MGVVGGLDLKIGVIHTKVILVSYKILDKTSIFWPNISIKIILSGNSNDTWFFILFAMLEISSLLDISERTGIDFNLIKRTADRLIKTQLVEEKNWI